MNRDETFQTLKSDLESNSTYEKALRHLKEGVEIEIIIGGDTQASLFRREGRTLVENREASNPDVIFHIKPETVFVLKNAETKEVSDLGVAILKEILAGNITMKVPGSLWNLTNNGYLLMIKEGGSKFLEQLTFYGVTSMSKLTQLVEKMKK